MNELYALKASPKDGQVDKLLYLARFYGFGGGAEYRVGEVESSARGGPDGALKQWV